MLQTAAHLTDHVFRRLPARQWVLLVPWRLRYNMKRERGFGGRGLLESFEAKEMLGDKHSGFSVNAGGRIEAHDRAWLQRLLRYWACPPFAMYRLRTAGLPLGRLL